MEVADERADAGRVVGVEGNTAVLPFEGGGVAVLGAQRESPKFFSSGLAVSSQENGTVLRENCDRRFSNRMRQSWSHRGPIPIRLWWKLGMICQTLVCRLERRMSQAAEEKWGAPLAVPTTTLSALGFTLAQGAFGVR